jgi:hypothetical protein
MNGLVAVPVELRPVLARYIEEARAPFDVAIGEAGATLSWLEERSSSWLAVAQHCQAEVAELTSALDRCQSAAHPELDRVKVALHEAEIRVGAARKELARMHRWARALADAQPA